MSLTGIRLLVFLALVAGPFGEVLSAQAPDSRPALTGGSFVVNGKKVDVLAAEIARHLDLVLRLNPGATPAFALEAAWSRAIRIGAAKTLGLAVTDDEFKSLLESRYADLAQALVVEKRFVQERFADDFLTYARTLGFTSAEECFAAWREEMLGQKFVDRLFPPPGANDDETAARFAAIHTTLTLDVFTFAPEFLPESDVPSRSDPAHIAQYKEWYRTVPDMRRRFYDDDKHPSMESEAVTVRFNDKTPAEFKTWFETPRGVENLSIAERTKDIRPTVPEMQSVLARWMKHRRTQYLYLSKTLKPGLGDEEAFPFVRDDLMRQFLTLKFLESLWKKLRAETPPVDMKAVAETYGLEYIHMPMRVLSSVTGIDHNNDPRIGGDHVWTMRKIPPGTIYDYRTLPPDYFTEGIVDQPGWHGTIFKLVRAEEMQALDADQAIDRAWVDFTLDWRWAKVRDEAAGVEKAARQKAVQLAKEKGGRPEPFFADGLADAVKTAEASGAHAKWIKSVRMRPYRDDKPNAAFEGPVGKRVVNFLLREWSRWGGPTATFVENRALAPFASAERHIAVFPVVRAVTPADPKLWKSDIVGKKIAQKSVIDEREAERQMKVRAHFGWPAAVTNFKLDAPDLNLAMQKDLEAAWPAKSK